MGTTQLSPLLREHTDIPKFSSTSVLAKTFLRQVGRDCMFLGKNIFRTEKRQEVKLTVHKNPCPIIHQICSLETSCLGFTVSPMTPSHNSSPLGGRHQPKCPKWVADPHWSENG